MTLFTRKTRILCVGMGMSLVPSLMWRIYNTLHCSLRELDRCTGVFCLLQDIDLVHSSKDFASLFVDFLLLYISTHRVGHLVASSMVV